MRFVSEAACNDYHIINRISAQVLSFTLDEKKSVTHNFIIMVAINTEPKTVNRMLRKYTENRHIDEIVWLSWSWICEWMKKVHKYFDGISITCARNIHKVSKTYIVAQRSSTRKSSVLHSCFFFPMKMLQILWITTN